MNVFQHKYNSRRSNFLNSNGTYVYHLLQFSPLHAKKAQRIRRVASLINLGTRRRYSMKRGLDILENKKYLVPTGIFFLCCINFIFTFYKLLQHKIIITFLQIFTLMHCEPLQQAQRTKESQASIFFPPCLRWDFFYCTLIMTLHTVRKQSEIHYLGITYQRHRDSKMFSVFNVRSLDSNPETSTPQSTRYTDYATVATCCNIKNMHFAHTVYSCVAYDYHNKLIMSIYNIKLYFIIERDCVPLRLGPNL